MILVYQYGVLAGLYESKEEAKKDIIEYYFPHLCYDADFIEYMYERKSKEYDDVYNAYCELSSKSTFVATNLSETVHNLAVEAQKWKNLRGKDYDKHFSDWCMEADISIKEMSVGEKTMPMPFDLRVFNNMGD